MTSMSYERSKGHSTTYDVTDLGFNYRIDDIRSAIGIVQLGKLEEDLKKRRQIREHYLEHLGGMDKLIIPFRNYTEFSSNYIFPVVLKNSDSSVRDSVRNILAEAGIQTSIHYPAVHRFSIYIQYKAELPNTEYVSDNLITLPMYSSLISEQIHFITGTLGKLL